MLRAIPAAVVIGIYTLALGPLCLAGGLLDPSGRFAHRTIRLWGRLILRSFGVRVRLEGLQHLPAGPAVFAANHASAGDIPITFGSLPLDFRIIHKRSLSFVPVIGWCLWAGGHIAIDRGNAFRARRSLEAAERRIRGGTSVLVFPEGTRSADGDVGHFKRGSFLLALNAGVPIVPVSLVGVRRVMPRGLATLRRGEIRLLVHPAIPTAGRAPEDAALLAEETRRAVARGCEEALS